MSRRTALVLAALVAAGTVAVPLPARSAAAAPYRTWRVHRTASRPIPFTMRVDAKVRQAGDTNEGVLFTLRMVPPSVDPARFSDFGVSGVGREPLVRTYGVDGAPPSTCGQPCDVMNGTRLFDGTQRDERSAVDSEWYVAAYNLDVTITVGKGWRVDPIPNRLQVITGAKAAATGVRSHNVTVEHFTKAAATGGKYGSFAFAAIPCTSAGVGSATLKGGRSYHDGKTLRPLTCDAYTNALTEAVAYGPTRWSLEGDVTGWSSWPERLLVFSLPHRYG